MNDSIVDLEHLIPLLPPYWLHYLNVEMDGLLQSMRDECDLDFDDPRTSKAAEDEWKQFLIFLKLQNAIEVDGDLFCRK
jgi:hypothetical protein